MTRPPETGTLGEFLAASRSRVELHDVGLRPDSTRRRVPGLRREEIALLAGVSASYYTRLEQGQVATASPQVLQALAGALNLSPAEREHLEVLGRPKAGHRVTVEPAAEIVTPAVLELLDNLGQAPALVVGRRRDVLAWNRMGHALFAGHLDPEAVHDRATRPNATEQIFLDLHMRDLYVDWHEKAQASVGHLRMLAAQFPRDSRLLELIGRLTVASPEFTQMWASHRIRTSTSAIYRMRHPLVGQLSVTQQLLTSPDSPGQTLIVCTAPHDSPSREALQLLVQLVHH